MYLLWVVGIYGRIGVRQNMKVRVLTFQEWKFCISYLLITAIVSWTPPDGTHLKLNTDCIDQREIWYLLSVFCWGLALIIRQKFKPPHMDYSGMLIMDIMTLFWRLTFNCLFTRWILLQMFLRRCIHLFGILKKWLISLPIFSVITRIERPTLQHTCLLNWVTTSILHNIIMWSNNFQQLSRVHFHWIKWGWSTFEGGDWKGLKSHLEFFILALILLYFVCKKKSLPSLCFLRKSIERSPLISVFWVCFLDKGNRLVICCRITHLEPS